MKLYVADTSSLTDECLFLHYYSLMPLSRKKKIDSLLRPEDKRLSLGAGILLCYALREANVDASHIKFSTTSNNKPYIANSHIFFTLSHSESKVMCAISTSEIGGDIQHKHHVDLTLSERFFSPEENSLIQRQQTDADKQNLFFRLWTLKESFMKTVGLGFKLPLNQFCIFFDEKTPKIKQKVSKKQYFFKEFDIFDDYALSVCSENDDFSTPIILDFSHKIL